MPSKSEGFPKVILEAASVGIPSIVYDSYGASEWMQNNKNGFIVKDFQNVIDIIDLILVMTVNPGFGGQSFLSSQLPKVSKIRTIIDDGGHCIDLSVDGGINPITAKLAIDAGANILVAGTSIFKAGDETYSKSIKRLRNLNP